ncbi:MAG: flagellar motor protein MotA [Acidocella sp. 20-57-95]|nr:MAG: flagellar motor protein MotA [Acidocella sp. 20-57-95]OYV58165.1 MAG: flagellar motor protein MotA [Acidocella sp. 21-58-7]HQT64834.1 MotA/TolQ/ExbB proton channel family protein [Acidocella sp.]HQU04403.1 MotA/TolQ/ExbB proton channel family protein [Acidocella sp.]
MTLDYIVHLANYSDGVLYILAFLLLVALAVMIDRFWSLRTTIMRGKSIIKATAAQAQLGRADLQVLLNKAGSLPEAVLVDTALRHLDVAKGEALANRLDESIMLIAPKLDERLWVLDTVVTLAPLLGLFGTIIGMFHAFSVLASPGHAPADVTAGVADALVATACGIFIAMLGLSAFNALNNQVRIILHQLDSMKLMIINRTDGAPMVAARQSAPARPLAAEMQNA